MCWRGVAWRGVGWVLCFVVVLLFCSQTYLLAQIVCAFLRDGGLLTGVGCVWRVFGGLCVF